MTVASGTRSNVHAYWLLAEPVSLDLIEAANRDLAKRLGADSASCDAARVLRPPSLNHKHDPPAPVRIISCDPTRRTRIDDIVDVAGIEPPRHVAGPTPRANAADELLRIDAREYVELLTGVCVGRDRKIRCPFHKDDTPSLHVYRDPARGWYCYGCGRGGSIYDFAAHLWRCDTRGPEFVALRERLIELVR